MQSLNNVAVLEQIGPARLAKLINEFSPDLAEINLSIPTPNSGNGSYFDSLAALLSNPSLPRRLSDAVATLETAAAPENQSRIDEAIARRLPCVGVSTTCALDRVLELWFQARDELSQFSPSRNMASADTPSPPLEERDGERRPSHVCPSTSDICCPPADSTIQRLNVSTPPPPSIQHPESSIQEPSNIHQSINPSIHPSTLDPRPSSSDSPKHRNTDLATFQHLASLAPADYDRVRKAEAKRLGIRVETLDAEVDRQRQLMDDEKAREVILKAVVPWPEPVNGAEVLDQVASRFTLHVVMHPCAADAIALWEAHAHIFTAFRLSPRLNLTSPEPECGKTTTLDLIAAMAPRPLRTESLTAPVLFRVVAQQQPVLLLDEIDTFLPCDKELRGLLNAGHKRGGCAFRCEGTNNAVRAFKAFAPAVLAGIGALSGTLHGRSIRIHLVKAKEGEVTAHFNELKAEIETELCRKIARWTQDNFAAIAACDPVMPKAAFNRLGDNWRPLFAIAQIAGGGWPARAIAAFTHLSAPNHPHPHPLPRSLPRPSVPAPTLQRSALPPIPDPRHLHLLLRDLRSIFTATNRDRLFSKELVSSLCALPDRPWSYVDNGRPITQAWLGHTLGQLGIHPRNIQFQNQRCKGYRLADFSQSFSTLPLTADSPPSSFSM